MFVTAQEKLMVTNYIQDITQLIFMLWQTGCLMSAGESEQGSGHTEPK